MDNDTIHDISDMLARFSHLGKAGWFEGFFALHDYRIKTGRQVRFAELASQAMHARRRVLDEAVRTVAAQVEAEVMIRQIMDKRTLLLAPASAAEPPSLPPPAAAPRAVPAVQTYVSDQVIEDEAFQAAMGYAASPDKDGFWAQKEREWRGKDYPDSVIADIRHVAEEVIRRTER
jgi:hypothetical protein